MNFQPQTMMKHVLSNKYLRSRKIEISFGRTLTLTLVLLLCSGIVWSQAPVIRNDQFWTTTDGQPINSQGGGIFKFNDPKTGQPKYYWYGVHYKEGDLYRADPSATQRRSEFVSVTCYSSEDMINWKFENDVLLPDEVKKADGRVSWFGRLGVAYIKEINKFAIFAQHGVHEFIGLADTPTGTFRYQSQMDMTSLIGTSNTGDQTVFTDEDSGKSYLIYSYGRGRNKIYVSEIGLKDGKVGLLDCIKIYEGAGREGNCMFKYHGKYYTCASDLYGWDASHAYYLVADDIRGPYLPKNNMQLIEGVSEDYGHITQTGFFYTVKGNHQETVIFCGDRWADFAGNGLGYNQWCPLSFEGNSPYFNSLSAWSIDVRSGTWTVAASNNFVKNYSFEADRKRIPSTVKPMQEQLTGWTTMVLKGSQIKIDTLCPALNHENTQEDRKVVVGEKSLSISDNTSFSRKTFQIIFSTKNVQLKDGYYRLSAKVRCGTGLTSAFMYAESDGKAFRKNILGTANTWQTVQISKILVRQGKVEIGFIADGGPGAYCYVDDVGLMAQQ